MRISWNRGIGTGGLTLLLTLALAGGAMAQNANQKPKIAESQARDSARARVPHGHVQGEELEREGGRLIYSYDMKVPGRSGIQEVNVDAMTGEVVGTSHEGAAQEKAEAAQEKGSPPATAPHEKAEAGEKAESHQKVESGQRSKEAEAGESVANSEKTENGETAHQMAQPGQREQARTAEPTASAEAPFGEWAVKKVSAKHKELKDLQVAVPRGDGCDIVAATEANQVGQSCTDEELQPLRTGKPVVRKPAGSDSLYQVTENLHDSRGNFVGTVVMRLAPSPMSREAALNTAAKVRSDLETLIPSEMDLFQPAPNGSGS